MSELVLCPVCHRHVKRADSACPFCRSTVRAAGVGVVAVAAIGLGVAFTACESTGAYGAPGGAGGYGGTGGTGGEVTGGTGGVGGGETGGANTGGGAITAYGPPPPVDAGAD